MVGGPEQRVAVTCLPKRQPKKKRRRKLVPHKQFAVQDEDFKKSSYTHPGGIITRCVAVAIKPHGVAVRNSLDPNKNTVFFTTEEWDAFVKGVKNNEFDLA
jgi:hypothetical protein